MSSVMIRRRAAIGLAALCTAAALPHRARSEMNAMETAARQEGSLTWYTAQLDTETAEAFGRAFTTAHPGITVEVIRTTGQVAFQRLMLDLKNGTPHCDVFSATDIAHMPILRERNALMRFTPESFAGMRPQFIAQSEAGWYYPTNAGRWALVRNRDKVPPEAAPKAWTDLLDARWKGRVSVAHPNAAKLFMEWLLSEDYSRLIAAQGSEPIHAGVPPRPDEPLLEQQKVVTLTVEEIRKGLPELVEQWRDTFGG